MSAHAFQVGFHYSNTGAVRLTLSCSCDWRCPREWISHPKDTRCEDNRAINDITTMALGHLADVFSIGDVTGTFGATFLKRVRLLLADVRLEASNASSHDQPASPFWYSAPSLRLPPLETDDIPPEEIS